MTTIKQVFKQKGLLSKVIDGYSYRQQQAEMAEKIGEVISKKEILISEAGTGTGKTFAYLTPALLSGLKIIVSTGTKNLQEQLFHHDLPVIKKALKIGASVALLKGRANYLCTHRLNNAVNEGGFLNPYLAKQLQKVSSWAYKSRQGDIAELSTVSEDAEIWPYVTSTVENCLGTECPSYEDCFLVEARKKAQEADLVVVNHHLLCADFILKEEGFGELLPAADVFIIDEAHQIHDIASRFFGFDVTTRQFIQLIDDSDVEYHIASGDYPAFTEAKDDLEKAVKDFRLLFPLKSSRGSWSEIENNPKLKNGLEHLNDQLIAFEATLKELEGRSKGLESCFKRCIELREKLAQLQNKSSTDDKSEQNICWFETFQHSFRLTSTPLKVGKIFNYYMESREAAWIFTSATLAVNHNFDHFQQQLGIEKAEMVQWDSPFDYQNQALWFVPRGLPNPNDPAYNQAVSDLSIAIINASKGRAFLLFTSYRALNAAEDYLKDKIDYPLFVQGSMPKSELLAHFKKSGNGVLLGTTSFWEGVDVRGEALSCVIIDKLPFAAPNDPVLQARLDAMKKNGGNPFMDYQLPHATITLKQGAGRLIRDHHDRGVLTICDPRLLQKSYGHHVLASMPDFKRSRVLNDVLDFFA